MVRTLPYNESPGLILDAFCTRWKWSRGKVRPETTRNPKNQIIICITYSERRCDCASDEVFVRSFDLGTQMSDTQMYAKPAYPDPMAGRRTYFLRFVAAHPGPTGNGFERIAGQAFRTIVIVTVSSSVWLRRRHIGSSRSRDLSDPLVPLVRWPTAGTGTTPSLRIDGLGTTGLIRSRPMMTLRHVLNMTLSLHRRC